MKHHIYKYLLVTLLLALLLAGCAQASRSAGSATPGAPLVGSIQGQRIEKTSPGEELFFTIPVDQSFIDTGQGISIRAGGKVDTGELRIVFRGPDGQTAWDPGRFGGDFTVNTTYQPTQVGDYRLGAAWNGTTQATYDISYQADRLTPAVLIPGLGMILVSIAFIVYALRRGGTWRYMGLGALAWVVTVAVKFIIAIPINPILYRVLYNQSSLWAPGSLLFDLYVGALTGLTEVLLTWLLLRYTRLGLVPWNKVLAFGVGFGAFEALLLGLASFGGMLAGLLAPQMVPAGALASMLPANNILFDLAPIAERIATIFCHILSNALLFYGVTTRRSRWLWVSFAFKSLLDTVAAFAQMWGVGTLEHIWIIEGILIVFGILGWAGTRAIARRYPGLYVRQPVSDAIAE